MGDSALLLVGWTEQVQMSPVQMSPACPGVRTPSSLGGRALDNNFCQAHQLLPLAMQVEPCSPDWNPHLHTQAPCIIQTLPST